MRTFTAKLIAPILKATGLRFSKAYRYKATTFHSAVYAVVDTVLANVLASV